MTKQHLKNISLPLILITFAPHFVMAQPVKDFEGLVGKIYGMLSSIVPLIVALTLIVFLWGIFQLVRSNSEDSRADAIKIITFGVVALFVMVSVWGLVNILVRSFNLDNTAPAGPGLPAPAGVFVPTR